MLILASLVDIHGSSMCQLVLKNLNLQSPDVIFIVRKSKYDRYNMKFFLQSIGKSNSQVITYESDDSDPKEFKMNKTLLLAKPFLANNDKPVLVLNCSQIIEWDSNSFLYAMANPCVTGGILTFNSAHPRYGFLETDADGWVSKCALNTPISKHATAGVFYWKSGNDFIKYTEAAVAKGLDGCNKLACLYAYQKAIEDGCKIRRYDCRRVWEISSSQDLDCYLKLGV